MNIAFIPVRGGSKSIPLKNIKELAGKPLVYWTALACQNAKCIDKVIIATDSDDIKRVVLSFGFSKLEVYDRDSENAKDTSSTESVMLEYIKKSDLNDNDYFFLIQATSPLTQAENIDKAFKQLLEERSDSLLSCVVCKRFFWNKEGVSINYNYKARPRRQDFNGYMMENGAIYINKVQNILKEKNRLSGKISIYEMREYTATEIDEPEDWIILERLIEKYVNSKPTKVNICKMFLTDCDGVLTDGGMYYNSSGDAMKKFNTKDGMSFQLLKEHGIITGIITGENTKIVRERAKKLKIDEVHLGIKNKIIIVEELSKKYNIPLENIAYVGDDINDIEVLSSVGISFSPSDCIEKIKPYVKYYLKSKGGDGAVREAVEFLLSDIN